MPFFSAFSLFQIFFKRTDLCMKIVCNCQSLTEAITNVQRAVSTKSNNPALEGILFKANANSLTLCGYDLELGITTTLPAEVLSEGSVV